MLRDFRAANLLRRGLNSSRSGANEEATGYHLSDNSFL
jgi:hypothetical protein